MRYATAALTILPATMCPFTDSLKQVCNCQVLFIYPFSPVNSLIYLYVCMQKLAYGTYRYQQRDWVR